MLSNADVATMIPAQDLDTTRRFYEEVLGFSPISEDPGSVSYRAANGQFNLYQTEFAGTAQHTLIGWTVPDIAAAVRELADKGVAFERYDMPDFKTDAAGIAQHGPRTRGVVQGPRGQSPEPVAVKPLSGGPCLHDRTGL
jgi:catechol 2,3-dioxygenase-like lactoylglutathione lyase family enzyme